MWLKKYFVKYKSVLMYLIFGVLTTLVNIIAFWFFSTKLGYSVVPSNVLAWILAVLFAYVTNKLYVFESKSTKISTLATELFKFISFRILSGGIDTMIMFICVDLLHYDKMITKIFANVIVVIMNYIASKLFIFKELDA